MNTIGKLLLGALLALSGPLAAAHEPDSPPARRVLGALDFPTTTHVAAAQEAFIEGMLYLHLFEYRSAEEAFRRAQQLDPAMALAYWGEAATYTHPVWNQQDLDAGRAALARYAPTAAERAAKATDARERAFLALAEAWYGEGDKPARDAAALAAAESLAKAYPHDDEAQLLLSLTLLGANQGERNLPRFLRAAEIAKAVYGHNHKHPGAAHYWIHGMDDPQHAAGALEAAHALSKIAPDAGHSQHMTSHIFVALGRWQDVVDANVEAMRVVNTSTHALGQPEYQCGHYAEWLQYAWLQQGRDADAAKLLADCARSGPPILAWMRAHPGEPYLSARSIEAMQGNFEGSLARMRAIALVDAPGQRTALIKATSKASSAGLLMARGLAQAQARDWPGAKASLVRLHGLQATPDPALGASERAYLHVMGLMLEAVVDNYAGQREEALRKLDAAAKEYEAQPFDFGPPATIKPPRELLGEMLMAHGRHDKARVQFEYALLAAPQRAALLNGLAAAKAATAP